MRIVKSTQKPFVLLFLFCLLPLGALAQNMLVLAVFKQKNRDILTNNPI